MNTKTIIILCSIALLVIIAGCKTRVSDDAFAQCLSDKGVKMYGAFWCPHCLNQKEAFGSAWQYANYIECSLPDQSGQTEFCIQQNIKGYPTWEFADGNRVSGEVPLEKLAVITGCPLYGYVPTGTTT
ncbi:hypothetical protein HZB01_04765 [Candidatus Woesearchaeota archaeon]|nr:hypothetical protein [Candidatus Woesearchaeota archaeon]